GRDPREHVGELSCSHRNLTGARGRYSPAGDLLMKNVQMTVDGNILTIKVDLWKEFVPSSSGKTITSASTEGSVSVPDREEKVGLNSYRKEGRLQGVTSCEGRSVGSCRYASRLTGR